MRSSLGQGSSGSSTHLRMKRAAMPTWVEILPRHWGRGPMSYLQFLRRCKRSKSSQAHHSKVEYEVATNGCLEDLIDGKYYEDSNCNGRIAGDRRWTCRSVPEARVQRSRKLATHHQRKSIRGDRECGTG